MKYTGIIGTAAVALLLSTANATVWYIHPDSAMNCIQDCLDSCSTGDTVLVGAGTYYENINWPSTQGIRLISDLGPEVTIIDGNDTARVITITSVVDSTTIITGFTIQYGRLKGEAGAGIFCEASSPTISNNVIRENVCTWGGNGGGIFCGGNSTAIIRDNVIRRNLVEFGGGGGIACFGSSPIITGNTITENESFGGGGILCDASSPSITNNTITLNEAHWFGLGGNGGGIACGNNSAPNIVHCTITMNPAEGYGGGIYCESNSSPTIDSCTISNNDHDGVGSWGGCNFVISYCNITDNVGEAVHLWDPGDTVIAENNWWGDATGPYHPSLNPGGLGDTVSDYVDFDPWLAWPVGVEEQPNVTPVERRKDITATIFRGPLRLPEGKKCKVFDITGRVVEPDKITRGIYFVEMDNKTVQKVVKVK